MGKLWEIEFKQRNKLANGPFIVVIIIIIIIIIYLSSAGSSTDIDDLKYSG